MPKRTPPVLPVAYTIGHSTRRLEEFIALLKTHGVVKIADVRTIPRSATNPQFNSDTLPRVLRRAGIGYIHLPRLGGLRKPRPDSANTAWRNESFRGYADYMQTPEFEEHLQTLLRLVHEDAIALMCAEAVPWRCHRSLIADALVAHGMRVEDILSPTRRQEHVLRPWAVVEGTRVSYPAAEDAPVG
jgi:uncharacterized protein (DUF488 family)